MNFSIQVDTRRKGIIQHKLIRIFPNNVKIRTESITVPDITFFSFDFAAQIPNSFNELPMILMLKAIPIIVPFFGHLRFIASAMAGTEERAWAKKKRTHWKVKIQTPKKCRYGNSINWVALHWDFFLDIQNFRWNHCFQTKSQIQFAHVHKHVCKCFEREQFESSFVNLRFYRNNLIFMRNLISFDIKLSFLVAVF